MAPSIALAIAPRNDASQKSTSLQMQIRQIERQKGTLSHVTEKSLLEELATTQATRGDDEALQIDRSKATETADVIKERLPKIKAELIQHINYLQEQTLAWIDGLAFPISAQSRVAQNALSPALKSSAPTGSIETRSVTSSKTPSKQETRRLNDVSTAARAQTFQDAAAKLAEASKRVGDEGRKQSKYWEQMASLRARDWPISRLPNNNKVHVAHFGCAEALPTYRDKGIMALRQEESDNLKVAGQPGVHHQKELSIAIHRGGLLTGHSTLKLEREAAILSAENELLRARESLFQDELFGEAIRESRSIANMGIKCRAASIEFEVCSRYSVTISYGVVKFKATQHPRSDDALAAFIGSSLCLLLVAEHQHRHAQRTNRPPPPMSLAPRSTPESAILRPLIAQLQHQSLTTELANSLRTYTHSIDRAGLSFSVKIIPELPRQDVHSTLQSFRNMISSATQISFPSGRKLTLRADTHLAPPILGTRFQPATTQSTCGASSCPQTSISKDVVDFMEDAVVRDIGSLVLGKAAPTPPTAQWELLREYPLVLELKDDDKVLATLSLKCHRGSIYAIFESSKDRSKLRSEWHAETAHLIDASDQRLNIDIGLIEKVSQWSKIV